MPLALCKMLRWIVSVLWMVFYVRDLSENWICSCRNVIGRHKTDILLFKSVVMVCLETVTPLTLG